MSFLFWAVSVVFTIAFILYQRITGPTYEIRGKVEINNQEIKYKLLRTTDSDTDQDIRINVSDTSISGYYKFKRYKSYDEWTTRPMIRENNELVAYIPHQPTAGKVEYSIVLIHKNSEFNLSKKDVIIRYKGKVPIWIVVIHVLTIFTAMLLSTRAGLEALISGKRLFSLTYLTIIFLIIGGMIFGPIMQKYAFGAYWTGWPIGHDLTDNKTAVALLFWLIAFFVLLRSKLNRTWPIIASVVLIIVYLIPHSVLGSEIDHTKNPNNTEVQE